MRWDIVTLSLGCGIDSEHISTDVLHLQIIGFPECEEILIVNDASEDVGSGGSALNALIRTTERLCYRNNFTVLNEAVLQKVNVLIVLVNDSRALLNSTSTMEGGAGYLFKTNLTSAIENASKIAERANEKGVWVIGSDCLFSLESQPSITLPQDGITAFSFTANRQENAEHGWYRTTGTLMTGMEFDDVVLDSTDGMSTSLIILGFVYMPLAVSVALLSLHSKFPVAATTYLGVDSNVKPLKLSLFFDFILATCTEREEFVHNKLGVRGKVSDNLIDRSHARMQIYDKFFAFKGYVEELAITEFSYKQFPTTERNYERFLECLPRDLLRPESVERTIRTELSIQKALKTKTEISQPFTIISALRDVVSRSDDPEVHLQVIYSASLALSIASNGKGGLRDGPAKNSCFSKMKDITSMFDEILKNWLQNPSKMIRGARHLETAAQGCIRRFVDDMCLPRTINLRKSHSSPRIVKVTAPARIDFFGGWLDTPPIFFSMDYAAVVNMAIQLDGQNPITCILTKIDTPIVEVVQDGITIRIQDEKDLFYIHDKPTETGSLVCACIIALNFESLADFFEALSCKGLRIETHSTLPHGSGLGTSSTIAGTILKAFSAMANAAHVENLDEQLVHTVLRVEQIMTTGGGWQDQVGSLYPGLKKCYYSRAENRIVTQPIPLDLELVRLLEQRLLLVYTGKTRLAKHLLQEVIRNFYTCSATKSKLLEMSKSVDEFAQKIGEGELPIGLINEYHSTKKFMTRCEPPIVTELLETLKRQNMIDVGWAAGAGGGGFLYLWLEKNTSSDQVKQFLSQKPRFSNMTCHSITISTTGLLIEESFQ